MTNSQKHYDNNTIITISVSIVGGIVFLMTLALLFLLLKRRKIEKRAQKTNKTIQTDQFDSSMTDDNPGNSRRRIKVGKNDSSVPMENHIKEQNEGDADNISDSFGSAAMMGSSSQSGQYHFSLREAEFPELANYGGHDSIIPDNVKITDADVHERKLKEITEESSDSDYDATFETTVVET